MQENDVNKLTNDTIAKGGVLAVLYFDLHASKKEVLQQLGAALVQKLLSFPGVVYAVGEIDEPIENQDMLSTSIEIKILTKDFSALASLCANYSPFSVEVIKPEVIKLTTDQAHSILMEIGTHNYELKKFILERVYKPEDLERLKKTLESRVELGKRLLEKKK